MPNIKTFYTLDNPLNCMFFARDIVLNIMKKEPSLPKLINVVLPDHIDAGKFEKLLLEDLEFFSGLSIYNISSFSRSIFKAKGRFDIPDRFDQIKLSEYFFGVIPKSLFSSVLKAVQELKGGDFESDYLKDRLEKRKDKEGTVLLEVFKKYQEFLKVNNVFDDADYKKELVDECLKPGSKLIDESSVFVFAGFNEFTSFDMGIISAVSKRASNISIVSPNILSLDCEYIRDLTRDLKSFGFRIQEVEDERKEQTELYEFSNINDEVYYAGDLLLKNKYKKSEKHLLKKLNNSLNNLALYALSNLEAYYALARYHFGNSTVAISSAMRLDRSIAFNMITTVLELNINDWTYNDVIKILNYTPFWKKNDECIQDEVLRFIAKAKNMLTLPRRKKVWLELANKDLFPNVSNFFTFIADDSASNTKDLASKAIELITFIDDSDIDLELKSIKNMISRLAECLNDEECINEEKINTQSFVYKLYEHAQENYVEKGPLSFKALDLSLANICSANMAGDVFFLGLNEDALVDAFKEDIVMNDKFILAFRTDGFLYPSSKERSLIYSKIIKDAVRHSKVGFISSIGPVASILKEAVGLKDQNDTLNIKTPNPKLRILETAITELKPNNINIVHKYKVLSASLLETYIQCPYLCLAQRLLKAQKQEKMEFALHPIDVGRLLHTALELMLPKRLKTDELDIECELNSILIKKEYKELLNNPLRDVFIKYYAGILKNILDHEYEFMRERGLEIFQNPELSFNVEFDFVKASIFSGKIDRIDIDKKNKKLYIADYKTSLIPKKDKIESGEDIQLAIYIMAIAKNYPDYDSYDAYYISIKELKHIEANFKSVEEARKVFSYYGDKAIQGIINGDYNPNPIDKSICEDCDYRRCCGAV